MRLGNDYITYEEYNRALREIELFKAQQKQNNSLPKFVKLGHTSMILSKYKNANGETEVQY